MTDDEMLCGLQGLAECINGNVMSNLPKHMASDLAHVISRINQLKQENGRLREFMELSGWVDSLHGADLAAASMLSLARARGAHVKVGGHTEKVLLKVAEEALVDYSKQCGRSFKLENEKLRVAIDKALGDLDNEMANEPYDDAAETLRGALASTKEITK
jgi:hypothetical protein